MTPLFITGIGTDVGKTIASAVLAQALQAPYWKPVQAGDTGITDRALVSSLTAGVQCLEERYSLKLAASPHLAARAENIHLSIDAIVQRYTELAGQMNPRGKYMIIEGAGGLLVPLNENDFVIDLIKALGAKVILVSRNYLGSINHSLLSALACRAKNIDVCGWLFNGEYMHYEAEIARWTGLPVLASLPHFDPISKHTIAQQAEAIKENIRTILP